MNRASATRRVKKRLTLMLTTMMTTVLRKPFRCPARIVLCMFLVPVLYFSFMAVCVCFPRARHLESKERPDC